MPPHSRRFFSLLDKSYKEPNLGPLASIWPKKNFTHINTDGFTVISRILTQCKNIESLA